MITRLGLNEINSVLGKSLKTVSKTIHKPSPISLCGEQVLPEINLTSKRVKMLNLYNDRKIKDYLFNFSSNGEINVIKIQLEPVTIPINVLSNPLLFK